MKEIKIPVIEVSSKLMFYKQYINTMLPLLNKRFNTRGVDVIAAIMWYTNSIKHKCKDREELAKLLATPEARETIRTSIPDMYSDKKQKLKSTMENDYFNMVTTVLRKQGYFYESKYENKRYKSLLLKKCMIFDIALLEVDELCVSTTIKLSSNAAV